MEITLFDGSDASWVLIIIAIGLVGVAGYMWYQAQEAAEDAKVKGEKLLREMRDVHVGTLHLSDQASHNAANARSYSTRAELSSASALESAHKAHKIQQELEAAWMQKSVNGLHADDV